MLRTAICSDGSAAVQAGRSIAEDGFFFDLILPDIEMPGGSPGRSATPFG